MTTGVIQHVLATIYRQLTGIQDLPLRLEVPALVFSLFCGLLRGPRHDYARIDPPVTPSPGSTCGPGLTPEVRLGPSAPIWTDTAASRCCPSRLDAGLLLRRNGTHCLGGLVWIRWRTHPPMAFRGRVACAEFAGRGGDSWG